MYVVDSPIALLDEILDNLVTELQLTQTQFGKAKQSYEAVGEWLNAVGSGLDTFAPQVYPQGSLLIDTTVRPLQRSEFDLDLVCEVDDVSFTPDELFGLVHDRIAAHGRYRQMMERRSRCIRLNYAGDFHLDVVPAIGRRSRPTGSTAIQIPDRDRACWHSSDPKGYARWFEDRTAARRRTTTKVGGVQPLRLPQASSEKAPLKVAVQLFKRWRDVTYTTSVFPAPSSIVLTTLAGAGYMGEEEPVSTMSAVLRYCVEWMANGNRPLMNPANLDECISEPWLKQPDAFDAFRHHLQSFSHAWHAIVTARYADLATKLGTLFGDPAKRAFEKFASDRRDARDQGGLYVAPTSSGMLAVGAASAAVKVQPHTFFGREDEDDRST